MTCALIVAAGRGTRFGGALPKQYLPLGGTNVLRHAVAAFAAHPRISGVQVVIRREDRDVFDAAVAGLDRAAAGAGRRRAAGFGAARARSARCAHDPERVLIHDGARPFPDAGADRPRPRRARSERPRRSRRCRSATRSSGSRMGASAQPSTAPHLWRAQTPQGFHFEAILAAHRAAAGQALTDDAAVAEAAGMTPLVVVAGSEDNLKVTTARRPRRGRAAARGATRRYPRRPGFRRASLRPRRPRHDLRRRDPARPGPRRPFRRRCRACTR